MSASQPGANYIDELRQFISSEFLLDKQTDELAVTDLLFEGGIIDSAGAISLILHLEQTYDIEISDEELFPENFATIEHIVKFIERKRRSNSNPREGIV